MIFVSVGTQLPFERLIRSMDFWSEENPDKEVFAQVGKTDYTPCFMAFSEKLSPAEYTEKVNNADLIVSHVGMGTIITGLEHFKKMILMPRLAEMGEHRNDHQLGTAEKFSHIDSIVIVNSEYELKEAIDEHLSETRNNSVSTNVRTSPELINKLRDFIKTG
ncbi:MAG: hypothetical protein KTR17_01295 [Cellvibrionaceae bacterium]|nr:hypothetical protein [Cellvibrionaceae bacterium]